MVVGVCELEGARDQVFYIGFSRPSVYLLDLLPARLRRRRLPGVLRAAA